MLEKDIYNKMISIILPTYNRAELISETIQSILNQTYIDFELIVVSDGFQNKTKQVVESFKDIRLKYYEIQHSGRPSVPRNFGIKQAKGQYLAFCDDDDIWMPEKLELQLAKIVEDDRIGLVYAKCLLKEGSRERIIPKKSKEGFIFKELFLSFCPIATSTVLIRHKVIEDVGLFDEDIKLKVVEDYDFWLRIAKKYKIVYVKKVLIVHREGQDSISNSGILLKWKRQYLVPSKFYVNKHVGLGIFTAKILRITCKYILETLFFVFLGKFCCFYQRGGGQ